MTKAVKAECDQFQYGREWLLSRRGFLKVFEDRLECGDWTIHYFEIAEAVLYSTRSPLLFLPGYILKVQTSEETYHFGLNWAGFWKKPLPFPVKREKTRLKLSLFSLLVRVMLLALLIYLLWSLLI